MGQSIPRTAMIWWNLWEVTTWDWFYHQNTRGNACIAWNEIQGFDTQLGHCPFSGEMFFFSFFFSIFFFPSAEDFSLQDFRGTKVFLEGTNCFNLFVTKKNFNNNRSVRPQKRCPEFVCFFLDSPKKIFRRIAGILSLEIHKHQKKLLPIPILVGRHQTTPMVLVSWKCGENQRQVAECCRPNYQLLLWGGMFLVRFPFSAWLFGRFVFLTLVPRSPSITVLGKTKTDGWIAWNHRPKHACMLPACSCSKEGPWPFHFSISRIVEPKNGESSSEHTKKHVNTPDLWTFCDSQNSRFQVTNFFWEVPWPNIFLGPEIAVFFLCQGFFCLEKNPTVSNPSELEWPALQFLDLSKKVVDDKRWVVILFVSSNSAFGDEFGCVCFFCWWISDPFFFHQKSWWNSTKAQAAGRNLANESIDTHPTSRGVSCFKSSLLVQGSCWQYQNKNITFTELRHYISRLLGKWCSSSIDGIYFSSQRGYVQCLEQVNQTYSPNADWIAW